MNHVIAFTLVRSCSVFFYNQVYLQHVKKKIPCRIHGRASNYLPHYENPGMFCSFLIRKSFFFLEFFYGIMHSSFIFFARINNNAQKLHLAECNNLTLCYTERCFFTHISLSIFPPLFQLIQQCRLALQ